MPQNHRIFFATNYVALAPMGVLPFTAQHVLHGVQSVSMTTNFNLEQAFELGQLSLYQNIENIPDIEINLTKVLDGYELIYHAATRGSANDTLVGRSTQRAMFGLAIFPDTNTGATGANVSECVVSGTYVSAVSYEFPTEGNCTETVTLVANNKVWTANGTNLAGYLTTGNDGPIANFNVPGSGSIQRRQDILFDYAALGGTGNYPDPNGVPIYMINGAPCQTVLPRQIPGVDSISGTLSFDGTQMSAHIGRISIAANLGREALNELGHKAPYFRYVTFPVQITCDIEIVSQTGDNIGGTEAGLLGFGFNLQNESIRVATKDGTSIDLGYKNKCNNVTYGGGDTGGGNASDVYSYITFNDLTIKHPQQNN